MTITWTKIVYDVTKTENVGLYSNAKKMKVMKILRHLAEDENHQQIWANNETIENVNHFTHLPTDREEEADPKPSTMMKL